jgi:hypothetical protein
MKIRHDEAMRAAVGLALTGRFNNWWCIAARLGLRRYRPGELQWTESQRQWLDRLCLDAGRRRNHGRRRGAPARVIEFPVLRGQRAAARARA